jgi:hypothetical protein
MPKGLERQDLARVFLEPANATHRQYEALRAFVVDGLPSAEAARRFGYTPGSSAVAMKVDCDLLLTLMASSLYPLLGGRIGHGYDQAKSRHLFRDLVDASAKVTVGGRRSSSGIRSGPTTRCSSRRASTGRRRRSRGWVTGGSGSSSDKLIPWPRTSVV